jgi:UDPglucose--hexose-1-phosphate uridylyltransferase
MIYKWIQDLVSYGYQKEFIEKEDVVYVVNRICAFLKLGAYEGDFRLIEERIDHVALLEKITNYAYKEGLIESVNPPFSDLFDTELMNIMMPRPSEVVKKFNNLYGQSPNAATNYYYKLSKDSHYIRTDRVAKNMHWQVDSGYGTMDITVNLSKPEKDPKAIAMGQHQKQSGYPKCLLCYENVGYSGHVNHPARQSHRVIPLNLQNESWYLQYSPYVYFNEHSIVFKKEHDPMAITATTFERLLDFVDLFPHYFIGSNADLPIVGGSMLSHDHYQSGSAVFPMEKASVHESYEWDKYKDVEIEWLNWPLTVLRLRSPSRHGVSQCANEIMVKWRSYSDPSVDVYAISEETPHNTVTPIARKKDGQYELDIVLRNNRTSETYPDGIFHPHIEIHPVKKENIGLIEVMGLAVLPSRLKEQILLLARGLEEAMPPQAYLKKNGLEAFEHIYIKMLHLYTAGQSAENLVQKTVGQTFVEGLEHCGVFKMDDMGRAAMSRFIESLKG